MNKLLKLLIPQCVFLIVMLLNLQHFNVLFSFLITCYLLFFPGLIILLSLHKEKINFWENLLYSLGLSLTFLIFVLLVLNVLLPLIGIKEPLSKDILILGVNGAIFLLSILLSSYIREKSTCLSNIKAKLNFGNIILYLIPIILLLFAVLGANDLNNQGKGIFTLLMIGGIALGSAYLIIKKNVGKNILPFWILMSSLALLYSYSLRSTNISGWDIHSEYQIFQYTKNIKFWNPDSFPGNPYNACLSITLLPVLFSFITNIRDEYVFKLIFPFIFSFTSIAVYLISNKLGSRKISFISALFFISQARYITEMTTIMRQEIALLFFSLMVLILSSKQAKTLLFLLFGLSMILSHYSTTYVALLLFLLAYLMSKLALLFGKIVPSLNKLSKTSLKGFLLLFLIFTTFLWQVAITKTSNNLFYTVRQSINNMPRMLTEEFRSYNVYSILGNNSVNMQNILQEYVSRNEYIYRNNYKKLTTYPQYDYFEYTPRVTSFYNDNLLQMPKYHKLLLVKNFLKYSALVFIFIGAIWILLKNRKTDFEDIDKLIWSSIIILGIIIVLPTVSINYGIERLFQQLLIILSICVPTGLILVFKRSRAFSTFLLVVYVQLYLLFYSGFVSKIANVGPLGGGLMQVSNEGESYDLFYTHDSELSSGIWLSKNRNLNESIFVDRLTGLKYLSLLPLEKTNNDILPYTINKNAYVVSGFTNTLKEITFFKSENQTIVPYNYPKTFLEDNKNIIYSNKYSLIYR